MMIRSWALVWFAAIGVAFGPGCGAEEDTPSDLGGGGAAGLPFAGMGGLGGVGASGGVGGSGGTVIATGGVGGSGGAGGMAGMAGDGAGGTAGMAGEGASGGTGGSGGMPDPEGGSGGTAGEMHVDQGEGDGKDVVTIGDSWMRLIVTGIEPSLDKYAGKTYRHRAQAGTLVLNEQIPFQYEQEVAANANIKTIVMTGGGNDILGAACSGTACNDLVDDVFVRLNELHAQMGQDGVQDIIVIGYTHGSNTAKHAALDHSIMRNEAECTTDKMPRCHFIDGSKLGLTLQDGIHPNNAGYDLLGKTVWELMVAEGIRR